MDSFPGGANAAQSSGHSSCAYYVGESCHTVLEYGLDHNFEGLDKNAWHQLLVQSDLNH